MCYLSKFQLMSKIRLSKSACIVEIRFKNNGTHLKKEKKDGSNNEHFYIICFNSCLTFSKIKLNFWVETAQTIFLIVANYSFFCSLKVHKRACLVKS